MRARPARGELLLALLFAAAGIGWIAGAAGMRLWEGFAPQSGFLPLLYGVLLTLLAGAVLANLLFAPKPEAAREPVGKPLMILGGLAATAVGMEIVGFAAAIFLLLLYLFAGVERLALLWSVVVAAATTVALILIFAVWLDVPLPLGPMGF